MKPFRLTVALTHPVQYFSPWFRWLAAHCPEIDLEVIYAVAPTAEQQGTGFGRGFAWDVPLTEGYRATVIRPGQAGDELGTGSYRGLDVPELAARVIAGKPDAVLVPGWYSVTLTRVITACRRAGIPLIYRGDSTLAVAHRGLTRMAWRIATAWRLARYSSFLAVGSQARRYLLAHGVPGTAIFASPHCLDFESFARAAEPFREPSARAEARRALGLDGEDFVVLFAGKLAPIKRPGDLVAAVARLAPGAVLAVAGGGELAGELRALAERSGVRLIDLGFVNQSGLPRVYAAADVLALPSESETWGFAAHEALAAGTPVVVTETVGLAPDLVRGDSGVVVPVGDVPALAAGLERVRSGLIEGDFSPAACRRAVAGNSFGAATRGLVAALERLARPAQRILALASGMVVPGGLERQTFAVLRSRRTDGATVHGILNDWENGAIVPLVEEIGASWSTARYRVALDRRAKNPLAWLRMAADVAGAQREAWRAATAFRPSSVLVSDELAVVRHGLVLGALRAAGVPVVLRVGNAPTAGRLVGFLWRRVLPRLVSRAVANSEFGRRRLAEVGFPAERTGLVFNSLSPRPPASLADPLVERCRLRPTILVVGQIAPWKGTDLALAALERLAGEVPGLQLVIVGRWPDWPEDLVAWANQLRARAGDNVVFAGPREDVPELMAAATVLAAPIVQEETFGNVVLEARNAGLPAVVFARGGLPELVVHRETGWICEAADLDGLLAGLRFFLEHPEERTRAATAARTRAARPDDPYRPEAFAAGWRKFLP